MSTSILHQKKIILSISGGISAYKIPYLIRKLLKAGAIIQPLMTKKAKKFVSPLVVSALSQKSVITNIFSSSHSESSSMEWTKHIELGEWADVFILAPATANTIAKLANGFANDAISTTYLTLRKETKKFIVPAMDGEMYHAPQVQKNIKTLEENGAIIIPPAYGELASGLIGIGRMPEPDEIIKFINASISQDVTNQLYNGKSILITAGPTREKIDAVRFISNYSSGKMGFALAEVASKMGATVYLITGNTELKCSPTINRIDVESASDMLQATLEYEPKSDMIIAAAAVADYKPASISEQKIKKNQGLKSIELIETEDIVEAISKKTKYQKPIVCFALETNDLLKNAKEKIQKKKCTMIFANTISNVTGFHTNTNEGYLIDAKGNQEKIPLSSKEEIARIILIKTHSLL